VADPAGQLSSAWQSFYVVVGSSGAALGLLLVEIHNAWDTVVHIIATDPADGTHGD